MASQFMRYLKTPKYLMKQKKSTYKNKLVSAFFVIPFGFEPKTYCLEGSCSIQLSYGTSVFRRANALPLNKKFRNCFRNF
jgi:hypothetical protein